MNLIKTISLKLTLIAAAFTFLGLAIVPVPALANTPKQQVCEGIVGATGQSCDDPDVAGSLDGTIDVVINLLSVVIGVIAVIMIIVGGLKYIMSGGDSNSTSSAKNTILFALVGLVIVALAQVIARFVLSRI